VKLRSWVAAWRDLVGIVIYFCGWKLAFDLTLWQSLFLAYLCNQVISPIEPAKDDPRIAPK
jgi:hypothetical protein